MRLRFSIRDLLWLTLVVALATSWWLDHRRRTGPDSIAHLRLENAMHQILKGTGHSSNTIGEALRAVSAKATAAVGRLAAGRHREITPTRRVGRMK